MSALDEGPSQLVGRLEPGFPQKKQNGGMPSPLRALTCGSFGITCGVG